QFFWISELLYLSAITFTKLSLLLFFRRIFPSNGFRTATVWAGVFIIASNISLFMALAFQCMPVHGVWTNWMYKTPPVQCINVFAAVYIAAGMSITHDIMILCMPIPTLWSLNLGLRKKLNLMVMFGVGSFVIVASVIRLPSLMKMGASSDPSFDQAPVAFWTNLEVGVGIICACLPACRSLIGFYFPRLQMSLNNTSSMSFAILAVFLQSSNTLPFHGYTYKTQNILTTPPLLQAMAAKPPATQTRLPQKTPTNSSAKNVPPAIVSSN
ncbi:hypothetical protein DL98DRAFT_416320, partial [Cadophora sp. DSE1049]